MHKAIHVMHWICKWRYILSSYVGNLSKKKILKKNEITSAIILMSTKYWIHNELNVWLNLNKLETWSCIIVCFAMDIAHLIYFLKVDAIPITHQKDASQILIGGIPITNQNKNWNCNIVCFAMGIAYLTYFFSNECNIHHKLRLGQYLSWIGNVLNLCLC